MSAGPRDRTIDCLEGAAILAVIAIHAGVLEGSRLMTHLLNHAVPVFVVLFGLNAQQWCMRGPDERIGPWPYAGVLLAGALALVAAGNATRAALERVGRSPMLSH